MKKLLFVVLALTVGSPVYACCDVADPGDLPVHLRAKENEKKKEEPKSQAEKTKDRIVNGSAVSLAGAAGAYLSREKPLYVDALYPMPMDDAKAKRIMDATDQLIEKTKVNVAPENRNLIKRMKIKVKQMNRPIVSVKLGSAQAAEAISSPESGKRNLVESLMKLFKRNSTNISMDVMEHGGREHLEAQLNGLKEARHEVVPRAAVHSAGRKVANRLSYGAAAAGAVYAVGGTSLQLLELHISERELDLCNRDPSVNCESDGNGIKVRPRDREESEEKVSRSGKAK